MRHEHSNKAPSAALGYVARGNHLVAQNDEPEPGDLTEADLAEIDLQYGRQKAERFHRENDRQALADQVQQGRTFL